MFEGNLLTSLAQLLVTGVSVFVVAKLMPGMQVKNFVSAVFFAFLVGLLNALAWNFLAPLTMTFTVLTLGIGAFIVNGIIFLLADKFVDGVKISGCITAAIASLAVTFVNSVLYALLGMKH